MKIISGKLPDKKYIAKSLKKGEVERRFPSYQKRGSRGLLDFYINNLGNIIISQDESIMMDVNCKQGEAEIRVAFMAKIILPSIEKDAKLDDLVKNNYFKIFLNPIANVFITRFFILKALDDFRIDVKSKKEDSLFLATLEASIKRIENLAIN